MFLMKKKLIRLISIDVCMKGCQRKKFKKNEIIFKNSFFYENIFQGPKGLKSTNM